MAGEDVVYDPKDRMEGATEIADFLGRPRWNERKVYYVCEKRIIRAIRRRGKKLEASKRELALELSTPPPVETETA
jgi:hypothetical protein